MNGTNTPSKPDPPKPMNRHNESFYRAPIVLVIVLSGLIAGLLNFFVPDFVASFRLAFSIGGWWQLLLATLGISILYSGVVALVLDRLTKRRWTAVRLTVVTFVIVFLVLWLIPYASIPIWFFL